MFIWDFAADTVLDAVMEWAYMQCIEVLAGLFSAIGGMGVELFQMPWVKAVVLFFSYLAWALYAVGIVVSCFELGIMSSSGRGDVKGTVLNALKGLLAVNLFSAVPVELYKLSVNLQARFAAGLTEVGTAGDLASAIVESLREAGSLENAVTAGVFGGMGSISDPVVMLILLIMMGYAVIKVFFANLKRGGILLIQIAVGSLYFFSIPRGYLDGFTQWCKQIVGLCLTAFLQTTILTAGLIVLKEQAMLGLGLMLSAGEIPRIAGAFGLDTSTKASLSSAVYTVQAAVNTTKTVAQAVAH